MARESDVGVKPDNALPSDFQGFHLMPVFSAVTAILFDYNKGHGSGRSCPSPSALVEFFFFFRIE